MGAMMITVYLTDEKIEYNEARVFFKDCESWAREHCESFIQMECLEMSDFSLVYDQMATYEFTDEKDAFWFTTAWQS